MRNRSGITCLPVRVRSSIARRLARRGRQVRPPCTPGRATVAREFSMIASFQSSAEQEVGAVLVEHEFIGSVGQCPSKDHRSNVAVSAIRSTMRSHNPPQSRPSKTLHGGPTPPPLGRATGAPEAFDRLSRFRTGKAGHPQRAYS